MISSDVITAAKRNNSVHKYLMDNTPNKKFLKALVILKIKEIKERR